MYLRDDRLGQPNLPGNPVPMRNPGTPPPSPQPITQGLQIMVLRSTVDCSAGNLTQIGAIVGRPMTREDVDLAIFRAHNRVFADATDEEMPPRRLLAAPRNVITIDRFKRAFGVLPDSLPWRGARLDHGQLVEQRLHGARRTLGGVVRISCFGYPYPGGGADRPMNYLVKALPDVARVGLGALFWRAFRDGDDESMGAAMLVAGLVMRYGISYRPDAQPLRNIHCYVKYCLLMLQRRVPAWVDAKCGEVV